LVVVAAGCNDNDDKKAGGSNKECVTATECGFKHQARPPIDHFERLLKATCLNHTYPI
jgi:hypothetical protein